MSLQINFTKLTDCGCSATSDLGMGFMDAIDIANYDFVFKDDEDYDRLEGNGYFEQHYPYRHASDKDFLDEVNYCSVVVVRSKSVKSISANIFKQASYNGFPTHRFLLLCNDIFFDRIRQNNFNGNLIQVGIKLTEITDNDYYDKVASAEVEEVKLNNNSKNFDSNLIEKEIEDIKIFLKKKNCFGKFGQVADICNEFAESFRHLSKGASKFDLIDEINSLLSSFRSTFHSELNSADSQFIKTLREKYDFNFNPYNSDIEMEFAKLADEKERNQAISIFNHLWTSKKAEKMFRDGFPIGVGDAESLVNDYLRLQHVHSKTCEKILFDVLIAAQIVNYANNLQSHNQISSAALLSIPVGFYQADSLVVTNESGYFSKSKLGSLIFGQLFGLMLGGLFSWGVSGWIAGNNETARIVLFGSLFSAYLILVGLLYQNEKVDTAKEEHYFNVVRNMCNLHSLSNALDVKLMRHMINQLSMSGVLFQHQMLQLVSSIESRK